MQKSIETNHTRKEFQMRSGDRIKWSYLHSLNNRSKITRVKHGEYIGLIRHTSKYKGRHQLAMVQFDGNETVSRVPHCELEYEENRNERRS